MALTDTELQHRHRRTLKGTLSNKRAYCRKNAIAKGLEFSLPDGYLAELWNAQCGRCALSGVEMGYIGSGWSTASVDRIDPTKGYVVGNVQWTCWRVNDSKSSMTNQDFLNMCAAISAQHFTPLN